LRSACGEKKQVPATDSCRSWPEARRCDNLKLLSKLLIHFPLPLK
jgi:hypothetical protein